MLNFLKKINHLRLKRRNLQKLRSRENELIKFGPNAKAIFVETKQGDFLVDPRDNFVAKKLLNDGKYSEHEIKLASRFSKKKFLLSCTWWAHWLFSYSPCKIM
jgi:hypothetical protein